MNGGGFVGDGDGLGDGDGDGVAITAGSAPAPADPLAPGDALALAAGDALAPGDALLAGDAAGEAAVCATRHGVLISASACSPCAVFSGTVGTVYTVASEGAADQAISASVIAMARTRRVNGLLVR
jgi:hypothetical protein